MSKNIFSEFDVYALKKTLSLWAAKNNSLIDKYEELLRLVNLDEDEVFRQAPSFSRESVLSLIDCKKFCYRMILEDLRKPCDSFISDFERVNHDDSVLSKEIDKAMQLDLELKEND